MNQPDKEEIQERIQWGRSWPVTSFLLYRSVIRAMAARWAKVLAESCCWAADSSQKVSTQKKQESILVGYVWPALETVSRWGGSGWLVPTPDIPTPWDPMSGGEYSQMDICTPTPFSHTHPWTYPPRRDIGPEIPTPVCGMTDGHAHYLLPTSLASGKNWENLLVTDPELW